MRLVAHHPRAVARAKFNAGLENFSKGLFGLSDEIEAR